MAQLNALAQLQQLAATNPKIAAAAMLQLQQQHLLTQPPQASSMPSQMSNQHHLGNSAAVAAAAAAAAQLQQQSGLGGAGMGMGVGGGSIPGSNARMNQSRYQQLLGIIDEMGRDIRTSYLNNKNSVERLKRAIGSARILVRDCQLECERNAKI